EPCRDQWIEAMTVHQCRDDASSSGKRTAAMRITHVVEEEHVTGMPLKDKARLAICGTDPGQPIGRNLPGVAKVRLPREAVGPEQRRHRSHHVRPNTGRMEQMRLIEKHARLG